MVRALAAHLCGPGSNFGVEAICGSLLLVFSFAARGFHPGTPVSQFAVFTSPTIHLVYFPPKFCTSFVFNFSWGLQSSHEEMMTMLMQNLGANTLYFGRCASGKSLMTDNLGNNKGLFNVGKKKDRNAPMTLKSLHGRLTDDQ